MTKSAKEPRAPAGRKAARAKGRKAGAAGGRKVPAVEVPADPLLGAVEQALLGQLAARTALSPREVVARALHSYAAAVAPGLKLPAVNQEPALGNGRPAKRLFVTVDGKRELEVNSPEFTIGSAEGCDLRLDLPLIAPRHARLLWREGRHLFEDLRSARGSFLHGQALDVRFLEDGDEIDLGGFLPLRFRLS